MRCACAATTMHATRTCASVKVSPGAWRGVATARCLPIAGIFFDLDDFRQVNDTLGHPAGDALLCRVAARWRSGVRDVDVAVRLGGGEFAILLENVHSHDEARRAAE